MRQIARVIPPFLRRKPVEQGQPLDHRLRLRTIRLDGLRRLFRSLRAGLRPAQHTKNEHRDRHDHHADIKNGLPNFRELFVD